MARRYPHLAGTTGLDTVVTSALFGDIYFKYSKNYGDWTILQNLYDNGREVAVYMASWRLKGMYFIMARKWLYGSMAIDVAVDVICKGVKQI